LPKLPLILGKDVCKILESHGFTMVRQRGSHMVMQAVSGTGTITVPVPAHKELRIGTLRAIIRQSRIPIEVFVDGH